MSAQCSIPCKIHQMLPQPSSLSCPCNTSTKYFIRTFPVVCHRPETQRSTGRCCPRAMVSGLINCWGPHRQSPTWCTCQTGPRKNTSLCINWGQIRASVILHTNYSEHTHNRMIFRSWTSMDEHRSCMKKINIKAFSCYSNIQAHKFSHVERGE